MIEEVFGFPFLLQVGLCSLLHQVLQVIGILLHPGQQVVQNTGAALPVENTNTSSRVELVKAKTANNVGKSLTGREIQAVRKVMISYVCL